ncbi:GNAT family N-acetyltransferase [Rhodococcus daqingensis]|uniref:GNAT family N-acetyltransferase n=1 Tax=Rhodococcus daqingensis TaxID=2479363 RepID=A0ABW2S533_9NOCA
MTDEHVAGEPAPVVLDAPARHRFEVRLGADLAGFTQYLDRGGQRIFFHTEIGEQYGGRGLASLLIHDALGETVRQGKRIVPICPFVAGYLKKHDDFASDVDPVTPEALQAVRDLRA